MTSPSHWTLLLSPQAKKNYFLSYTIFVKHFDTARREEADMVSRVIVSLITVGAGELVTFSPMYSTERKKKYLLREERVYTPC